MQWTHYKKNKKNNYQNKKYIFLQVLKLVNNLVVYNKYQLLNSIMM